MFVRDGDDRIDGVLTKYSLPKDSVPQYAFVQQIDGALRKWFEFVREQVDFSNGRGQ